MSKETAKTAGRGLSVIMAAILMASAAGCGSTADNVSSSESSTVSSENTSLDVSSEEVSVPEVSMPDISIPDLTVSLPDMSVSVPEVSMPTFDFSSGAISSSSVEKSETSSKEESSSSAPESSAPQITGDTQTIGNSEMGYLDIPADFLKFEDVVANTDLQYSDKTATTIFTLNTLGDEDPADLDLEAGAQSLAQQLQSQGAQGLTGAKVKVAGKYDAYQVYGYWPEDDTFLVVDLFKTSKRGIYLAVEFPSSNVDIVEYLDTYREE